MENYTFNEEELKTRLSSALMMFMGKLAMDCTGQDGYAEPRAGEFDEIVRKIMKVFTHERHIVYKDLN